jgi:hypothetical protein
MPFIGITNSNTLFNVEDKEFMFLFKLIFYQDLREVSVLSKLFSIQRKEFYDIVVKRNRSSYLVD